MARHEIRVLAWKSILCRRLTKQDQPRRARRLGKATAFHGVGCSAWFK
jgi:hypothetical protein